MDTPIVYYNNLKNNTHPTPAWTTTTPLFSSYREYLHDLPCALDYVRYFAWHRSVVQELNDTVLHDSIVVYYEDYPAAVGQVLDFVGWSNDTTRRSADAPFLRRSPSLHTPELRSKVTQLGRAMCDDRTWSLLERYFDFGSPASK